jgi:hypothetical protein
VPYHSYKLRLFEHKPDAQAKEVHGISFACASGLCDIGSFNPEPAAITQMHPAGQETKRAACMRLLTFPWPGLPGLFDLFPVAGYGRNFLMMAIKK